MIYNYTLKQSGKLLDPVTLTYRLHTKGCEYTAYWPPAQHDTQVLLVSIKKPHTRALITMKSLDEFFRRERIF